MGNLMKNFCCVDNDDLIYNMNYPKSFADSLEKNKSLRKSNFSRMPEDTIVFENSRNKDLAMPMGNSASNIPICTKDVIIAKKGNPFEDYEIITKLEIKIDDTLFYIPGETIKGKININQKYQMKINGTTLHLTF